MRPILKREESEVVTGQKEFRFKTSYSLHLIVVAARVKSIKQISSTATDDDDLIVKIDGKGFPSLANSSRLLDSPAAFSGGTLHNLSKTVYFLTFLAGKNHQITLVTDQASNTATLEKLEIYTLDTNELLNLEINQQAEDGDRRPWLTFVFDQLPFESFTPTLTYNQRPFDSDDVKIIFDGKVYTNPLKTLKHFFWRFAGFLLPGSTRTERETFTVRASQGLHYLEFWADRKPILVQIQLSLGKLRKIGIASYQNQLGREYNRFDQFILEAVSFWNDFFMRQQNPPPLPLDPNLVKAVVYRESRLGYYPDEKIIDIMQVWDPQNPAKDALLGKSVANEFISSSKIGHPSYSYPVSETPPKVESPRESIFWGVRWLYHKAQYLLEDKKKLVKPYVRKWRSWKEAVASFNGNPKVVDEYVSEVFSVYEKGIDLEGNTLWQK